MARIISQRARRLQKLDFARLDTIELLGRRPGLTEETKAARRKIKPLRFAYNRHRIRERTP